MSTPTRREWLPATCGCGCRPRGLLADGCPCRECQPGQGLHKPSEQQAAERKKETRMMLLLHRTFLSLEEQDELDVLLDWYIRRAAET